MTTWLKSLLPTLLLGGIWGALTYAISSVLPSEIALPSFLFFPTLFTGIVFIIAIAIGSKIRCTRTITVGLVSGLVYQILSPSVPLLSSVLVGASIGSIAHHEGNFRDLLDRSFSMLKGIILFPIFIFVGGLLTSLNTVIAGYPLFLWFSWGALLGLAIRFINSPLLCSESAENDPETHSEFEEFKSEAQQILEELNRLASWPN